MRSNLCRLATAAALGLALPAALAWGPDGHHTVGAIADKLLAGSPAAAQVNALLGGLGLRDAAVWADCAKGVDPKKDFKYTATGKFAECKVFETPELEAEMIDFVRRNDTNCPRAAGDESCHREYHYTDEAIQRTRYTLGDVGTRNVDIVAALAAATHVLAGDPAPAPFSINTKREALLLLAHYLGDIHQPLHVGAVYLDLQGLRVDPAAGTFDPATETRGGNEIVTVHLATNRRSANLHQTWDSIPLTLNADRIGPGWLAQARRLPKTTGAVFDWPAAWASETLRRAVPAFAGLNFGPDIDGGWTTSLSCAYDVRMTALKKKQLTAAGARLAQVLRALFP